MGIMEDRTKHGVIEVMFGLSNDGVVDREVAEELEKKRKADKVKAKKAEKVDIKEELLE